MTIIYCHARDVAEYTAQGWMCWLLRGHHGARSYGKNYICVRGSYE